LVQYKSALLLLLLLLLFLLFLLLLRGTPVVVSFKPGGVQLYCCLCISQHLGHSTQPAARNPKALWHNGSPRRH
jgi:hypothetical protein